MSLRVRSIFESIDGEVNRFHQGRRTIFVRLAGCNLRCRYCDTERAQSLTSGKYMKIERVIKTINGMGLNKVTITGGEPLLQLHEVIELIDGLDGYQISVETNGTISIENIPDYVCIVMDYKLPSSGENGTTFDSNLDMLEETDFIKFIIATIDDFMEAMKICKRLENRTIPGLAFSPLHGELDPATLVDWLKEHGPAEAILNLQLHKYVWPDAGVTEV